MFALTPNQIAAIQAFNAGRISVTDFSDSLKAFGITIEELCPTPADADEVMLHYDAATYIPVAREVGADYGSHAALQVIVLSRKEGESQLNYCIVEVKGR